MKKFKRFLIIPFLAITAMFFVAARSAEGTQQAPAQQTTMGTPSMESMAGPATMETPAGTTTMLTTTEATVAETGTATTEAAAPTFQEKVAAKIAAKKLKKEMRKNDVDKTAGGKSQLVALLLCIFLGYLGIHRFYLGYTGIGVIQLLTGGGCGIWALIDLIRIITGDLRPKGGEYETTL
jgi:TM2 domain-containing membrane protein YozV